MKINRLSDQIYHKQILVFYVHNKFIFDKKEQNRDIWLEV